VRLAELVAHGERELELLAQVDLGRLHARVDADLETRFARLVADLQPHAIPARRCHRTGDAAFHGLVHRRIALELRRVGIAHVPHESVEAGFDLDLRLLRLRRLRCALRRGLRRRLF
jgi:hypothetical protein